METFNSASKLPLKLTLKQNFNWSPTSFLSLLKWPLFSGEPIRDYFA